jgi:hypothetical protein
MVAAGARTAAILRLVRAGKLDREITAALGVTKNTVIGARRRAGIYANRDQTSVSSMTHVSVAEPETLFDRMDALAAKLDAALAEAGRPARIPNKVKS